LIVHSSLTLSLLTNDALVIQRPDVMQDVLDIPRAIHDDVVRVVAGGTNWKAYKTVVQEEIVEKAIVLVPSVSQ
jgi:hypothetical protein